MCLCDGNLVILDARQGSYSYLPPDDAQTVLTYLSRAQNSKPTRHDESTPNTPVIRSLIENGLLTTSFEDAKDLTLNSPTPPQTEITGSGRLHYPIVTPIDFLRFVFALITSLATWKLIPFRYHKRLLTKKRQYNPLREADFERISHLIDIFNFLAPFFYTQKDRCFLNSLVLARFIRMYGLDASWVFGVTMNPFRAHCWVQAGDILLNESLYRTQFYTPILSI